MHVGKPAARSEAGKHEAQQQGEKTGHASAGPGRQGNQPPRAHESEHGACRDTAARSGQTSIRSHTPAISEPTAVRRKAGESTARGIVVVRQAITE